MRTYLIYGIIISTLFVTAHMRGYSIASVFQSAKWAHSAGPGGHK